MSSYPLSPAAPIQVEAEPNSGLSITRRGLKTIVGWLPGFGPGGGGTSLPAGGAPGQVLKLLSNTPRVLGWAEDKVASLNDGGTISFGQTAGTATEGNDPRVVGAMQRAQNGADIPDKGVFRTNLNLGGAATLNAGVSGGVALYDDPRFGTANEGAMDYLLKDNNLADLTNKPAARGNLGLGAAALLGVGSGGVMLFDDARVGSLPILVVMPKDGSDACPAFVAACNAALANPRGGAVYIPQGRYTFLTRPTINLPAGKRLKIVCDGDDTTAFVFPNTGGIIFNYGSKYSGLTIYDLALLCPRQNGGIAVTLSQPQRDLNPADTAQNAFYNVSIRGEASSDPNSNRINLNYWTVGYDCRNVSNINWFGGIISGPNPPYNPPRDPWRPQNNPQGVGIKIKGLSVNNGDVNQSSYAAAFNVHGTTFNWLNAGFIYGSWIQGLFMVNANFTACNQGVLVDPPENSLLHGLNLTQCQFGCVLTNINIAYFVGGIGIVNNLIVSLEGQIGVRMSGAGWSISGNEFNGIWSNGIINDQQYPQRPDQGQLDLSYGVAVVGGGAGVIDGNSFGSLSTCILINPGVANVNVGSNVRQSVTTYVTNQGSSCTQVVEKALGGTFS